MFYILLALILYLLPYPLAWSAYIKKVDYKSPTFLEKLCHFAGFIVLNLAILQIMPLSALIGIYLFFAFMLGMGAIFALPLALPALRNKARTQAGFRKVTIFVCTLLAVMSYTALFSYGFGMSSAYNDLEDGLVYVPEGYHDDYQHELGMRALLAPLASKHCFTNNANICATLDQSSDFQATIWFSFIFALILASLTGFGAWTFATQLTEPEKLEPVHLLVG